ncbi:MAG: isoprenylcysteine carboxylmethyltransferase family protein [bacterium]
MKNFASKIFSYRSYIPIPFLLIALLFQNATWQSLVVGFIIAIIGESFRFWGVAYAGSETRTTNKVGGSYLVVSGAFGHLRNPLYLGNILLYSGFGIMSYALFPYLQILGLIFFYLQYKIIIDEEEKYLTQTFGSQYDDYKKNVPRIFPRITSYKNNNIVQPPLNIKGGLRSERRTLQALVIVTVILVLFYLFDIRILGKLI